MHMKTIKKTEVSSKGLLYKGYSGLKNVLEENELSISTKWQILHSLK